MHWRIVLLAVVVVALLIQSGETKKKKKKKGIIVPTLYCHFKPYVQCLLSHDDVVVRMVGKITIILIKGESHVTYHSYEWPAVTCP